MLRQIPATSRLFVIALIAVFLSGCGAVKEAKEAAQRAERSNLFKQMGLAFHNHHDMHRKGPAGWDEFISWAEQSSPDVTETLRQLRSEGVVFFCGVNIRDATGGTSNSIFAYEPTAAESGGNVLFLDGAVRYVAAEEFTQILNAQKQESPMLKSKISR